jgi:hypothetical protein
VPSISLMRRMMAASFASESLRRSKATPSMGQPPVI